MYWNDMEKESKIKMFSFIEKALVLNKSQFVIRKVLIILCIVGLDSVKNEFFASIIVSL